MPVTTTNAVLLAGTIVEFEDPDATPTPAYIEIPEVTNIGAIGTQGSFVETTPIDIGDRTRKYIAGLKDPGENTLTFNWLNNNANQNLLRGWAENGQSIPMRVTMTNGATMSATVALSGFRTEELADANAPIRATVSYRASSTWVTAFA